MHMTKNIQQALGHNEENEKHIYNHIKILKI